MSTLNKDALIAKLGGLVMRWQDATQRYDEAVGARWGLTASERLCLSLLMQGPQMASAIAAETRLTPAAVTALVDRLAERDFVRRHPHPDDRRKVMVELAPAAYSLAEQAYAPLQEAGSSMLGKYSEAELASFARILEESIVVQQQMTEQLALGSPGKRTPPSKRFSRPDGDSDDS